MAKSTHFCGGLEMLSELSLNASHINCGMEQKSHDCDSEEDHQNHFNSNNCCDNEFEILHMDEDFSITKASINLHLDFAVAFAYTFIFSGSIVEPIHTDLPDYSPPILKQDHQVLFQTFLI